MNGFFTLLTEFSVPVKVGIWRREENHYFLKQDFKKGFFIYYDYESFLGEGDLPFSFEEFSPFKVKFQFLNFSSNMFAFFLYCYFHKGRVYCSYIPKNINDFTNEV